MTLQRFEVGIVSGDRAVVDFLAHVFELEALPPTDYSVGTIHHLRAPGVAIKVMVPNEAPAPGDDEPFLAVKGLRYLTMFVSELDGVLDRVVAGGGRVLREPFEFAPGNVVAIVADPDGNTIEVVTTT